VPGDSRKGVALTRIIPLEVEGRGPGHLRRVLDVGASGYLLKNAPSAQLADAIRRVAAGGWAIDPSLAAEAWTEPDPLTDRERQMLRLPMKGCRAARSRGS